MQATINGFRVNYAVEGPGAAAAPPVILHHPLATDLAIWDELTAALAPRYRVVRFDARGHGQSEATPAPYDFATLSADVVALLDHLGIARAHFLGLSMGGFVGQYLGVDHPQRFASLILCSTTSRMAPETRPLWEERARLAREKGMGAQAEPALGRWLTPPSLHGKPDLVARLRRSIETTPPEGYAGWCLAIRDLAGYCLCSGGRRARIVGAELIEVPGASHQLQVEDPATFNRHVLEFLARQLPIA